MSVCDAQKDIYAISSLSIIFATIILYKLFFTLLSVRNFKFSVLIAQLQENNLKKSAIHMTNISESSNINEVITSILNSFFYKNILHTHTHTHTHARTHTLTKHKKIKSSLFTFRKFVYTSQMYKVRTLFFYVLSVNVRALKIIINLIKHKNAYKQTKTKKVAFLCAWKTSKGKKATYSLISVLCFYLVVFLCL